MRTYQLEVDIPEEGDMTPDDGMPSIIEVVEVLNHLFRFDDAIPWYGEVHEPR